MGLVQEVKSYYASKRIAPMEFRCPHRSDCQRDCQTFTESREPYIGVEYERHSDPTVPRLLFLSLDPGSYDENHPKEPSERTIEAQRELEAREFTKGETGRFRTENGGTYVHWRQTYEMAKVLLGPFRPGLSLQEVGSYFAHTDSAKCCMNNDGRRQAAGRLFRNCREFIPGEIVVLRPDVLVTQGKMAKRAMEGSFPLVQEADASIWSPAVLDVAGRSVLWLQCHHPRYGGFFTQWDQCKAGWTRAVSAWQEVRR